MSWELWERERPVFYVSGNFRERDLHSFYVSGTHWGGSVSNGFEFPAGSAKIGPHARGVGVGWGRTCGDLSLSGRPWEAQLHIFYVS